MTRYRVLLADDHRIVAEGIKSLFPPEFEVLGPVEDGLALVDAVQTLRPDVILADITMPRLNGIEALEELRRRNPDVKVVFLTMHKDVAYVRRALEAGALGFVLKHSAPEELVLAVRAALAGKTFVAPELTVELLDVVKEGTGDPVQALTLRQREILKLLAEGRTAKEIAADLSISTRTVEFHKYQVMELLGVKTSAELIHFAIKHGLIEI